MSNAPLPPNWEQRIDPNSGAIFYANVVTRESTWERPVMPGAQPSDLPVDWEERLDPASGRYFYYNKTTKVTQWEKPVAAQPLPPPKPQNQSAQLAPPPPSTTATNRPTSVSVSHGTNDPSLKNLKFVTVGDGAVGKTCLLISFIRKQFSADYVPTVFDNKSVIVPYEGREYNIGIWDTAGQEEYDRLRPLSYPSTDCFLMCFSVVNPPSLDNCRLKWKTELTHYCPDAKIILVGTKKDLRNDAAVLKQLDEELHSRPVSTLEADKMVKELGCAMYKECSAKTMDGVQQVFEEAIKICTVQEVKKSKKKCQIL